MDKGSTTCIYMYSIINDIEFLIIEFWHPNPIYMK